jgi:hypothetical protein
MNPLFQGYPANRVSAESCVLGFSVSLGPDFSEFFFVAACFGGDGF